MAKRPTNPTKRSTTKPTTDKHAAHREALHEQVRQLLDLETLADRKRDSLDFHEISVSSIREIIALAFDAGINAASGKPAPVMSTDTAAIIALAFGAGVQAASGKPAPKSSHTTTTE